MATIAVDLDGTIAEYDGQLSTIGPPLPGAVETLQHWHDAGHRIVIYTCRTDLAEVAQYLSEHGIPYDAINDNPDAATPGGGIAKPLADVYIDDRAITFNDNWDEIREQVEAKLSQESSVSDILQEVFEIIQEQIGHPRLRVAGSGVQLVLPPKQPRRPRHRLLIPRAKLPRPPKALPHPVVHRPKPDKRKRNYDSARATANRLREDLEDLEE